MSNFLTVTKSEIEKAMQSYADSFKHWCWSPKTGIYLNEYYTSIPSSLPSSYNSLCICKWKDFKKQEDIPELLLILKGIPNDN